MRTFAIAFAAPLLVALSAGVARAQSAPREFLPGFDLDTARTPPKKLEEGVMRAEIHGEYQLRGQLQSDVPLLAPPTDPSASTLGQKAFVYHWLRITPRFQISDAVEIVGQIDVPRGFFGDTTRAVDAAREPMSDANPVDVDARWLYADVWTGIGLFRVGQQPNHFGMGLLANDGDHPPLFGDYRLGDISERILYATKPGGPDSPVAVFVAGDLVFRDQFARLTDGDHAYQALLGFLVGDEKTNLGGFGLVRHQTRDQTSFDQLATYEEYLNVRVADLNGRFAVPAPGTSAWVFGEAELAGIVGTTNYVRSIEETRRGIDEKIRSFGAATRLGYAHEVTGAKDRWADVTASLGWGWTSGDADPSDGTTKQFTASSNFKVGLVLFDHLLAWKTARAATLAQDPQLVARPYPGSEFLPTNGGVAGATYINPTVVVRPKKWLDLKGGIVLASTTADLVDPYRFGAQGLVRNYDGGDPRRHDLGTELDAGVEARVPLDFGMTLQLGAQAGVLFPGHAFDDEAGNGLPAQHVEVARVGLQY